MTDTDIRRGIVVAEDEALKAKLSNVVVTNRSGPYRVKTWFRWPSQEREITYPFITLDLIDISFAADRAHDLNIGAIDYWPSEYATMEEYAAAYDLDYDADAGYAEAHRFIPYNLTYQVTTYSRTAQHDREMLRILLRTSHLPFRHGYLDVPADESVRHLTLNGFTPSHYIDDTGKRVFRTVYNVTVTADFPVGEPWVYGKATSIHAELKVSNDTSVQTEEWDIVPSP